MSVDASAVELAPPFWPQFPHQRSSQPSLLLCHPLSHNGVLGPVTMTYLQAGQFWKHRKAATCEDNQSVGRIIDSARLQDGVLDGYILGLHRHIL